MFSDRLCIVLIEVLPPAIGDLAASGASYSVVRSSCPKLREPPIGTGELADRLRVVALRSFEVRLAAMCAASNSRWPSSVTLSIRGAAGTRRRGPGHGRCCSPDYGRTGNPG